MTSQVHEEQQRSKTLASEAPVQADLGHQQMMGSNQQKQEQLGMSCGAASQHLGPSAGVVHLSLPKLKTLGQQQGLPQMSFGAASQHLGPSAGVGRLPLSKLNFNLKTPVKSNNRNQQKQEQSELSYGAASQQLGLGMGRLPLPKLKTLVKSKSNSEQGVENTLAANIEFPSSQMQRGKDFTPTSCSNNDTLSTQAENLISSSSGVPSPCVAETKSDHG